MGNATENLQRAAVLPEDDVVRKLHEQHARIRELFQRVRMTMGDERKEAFDELRTLIVVHETAEETIVRPVLRKLIGDEEPNERNNEEAEATKVLEDLMNMHIDDADFMVRFGEFEGSVDEHADAEERDEFTAIEQNCSMDERASMGRKFEAAAKVAPTRPHPSFAGHEKTSMAVGPIAALADRTLDAIAKAG